MYITNELINELINDDSAHRYYVYSLHDPLNNKIFYIGKGCKSRYRYHWFKSSLTTRSLKNSKIKSINKTGYKHKVKIIAKGLYEHEAFTLESKLISLYGTVQDNTGPLTNMTSGGEGSNSLGTYERTVQHNAFMSANHKEKKVSVGVKNPMYGKKRPDAAERMKRYHSTTNTSGSNNSNAKTFLIYDNNNVLRHTITGNFVTYCQDNNLPKNALYESYSLYNSAPIYCKGRVNKKFEQYIGWYMQLKKKKY